MTFPIDTFEQLRTPFYFYDLSLLQETLASIRRSVADSPAFRVHYAVKANANPRILSTIAHAGFGADCVSGGEVRAAIAGGIAPENVVFAGVGKSDEEIEEALKVGISCFNVESLPELDVINELAAKLGVTARVAFRVNPNVDAHTHEKITTGLNENKFGIALTDVIPAIRRAAELSNVSYVGLHFHIGSQITQFDVYERLCERINDLQNLLEEAGIATKSINVGGGLGVDYDAPEQNPIPAFDAYFATFKRCLNLRKGQELHFELGRAVVAQCGALIAKTLYVKEGHTKKFVIVDAGFTELIRPAMYGALHAMRNLSAKPGTPSGKFDVVGPICESSDVFGKDYALPDTTRRGDLIAFLSAGAYGEVMASQYNCRQLPKAYFSE